MTLLLEVIPPIGIIQVCFLTQLIQVAYYIVEIWGKVDEKETDL